MGSTDKSGNITRDVYAGSGALISKPNTDRYTTEYTYLGIALLHYIHNTAMPPQGLLDIARELVIGHSIAAEFFIFIWEIAAIFRTSGLFS